MNGLNKVFIMGHVGHDPEMHSSQNGKPYVRLSIATNRRRANPNGGESKKDTTWHSVFVWGKTGENCHQNLKKGSPVFVEGYLNTYQELDVNGKSNFKCSIHAEKVEFLPSATRVTESAFES